MYIFMTPNVGSHSLVWPIRRLGAKENISFAYTSREEDWPVRKCELVKKYLKQFTTFVNSIDVEKLKWKWRKAKDKTPKNRKPLL